MRMKRNAGTLDRVVRAAAGVFSIGVVPLATPAMRHRQAYPLLGMYACEK